MYYLFIISFSLFILQMAASFLNYFFYPQDLIKQRNVNPR